MRIACDCLQCANSVTVLIDGEAKRYCQQCGKFHVLPDFDEGKRSCRRKLERHNTRRRRKPAEYVVAVDHEVYQYNGKYTKHRAAIDSSDCIEEPDSRPKFNLWQFDNLEAE